jgi:hypothetical protein
MREAALEGLLGVYNFCSSVNGSAHPCAIICSLMELELYRQVLKRFGWSRDDTASDEESETFFPPAELKTVLRGVSLHSKRGGTGLP